jgi:hypothetical protein
MTNRYEGKLTEQVRELQESVEDLDCNCDEINARLYEIDTSLHNSVCCPVCCYCKWESIIEEASQLDSDTERYRIIDEDYVGKNGFVGPR